MESSHSHSHSHSLLLLLHIHGLHTCRLSGLDCCSTASHCQLPVTILHTRRRPWPHIYSDDHTHHRCRMFHNAQRIARWWWYYLLVLLDGLL